LSAKRVEFLKVLNVSRLALLVNPNDKVSAEILLVDSEKQRLPYRLPVRALTPWSDLKIFGEIRPKRCFSESVTR
jgi:hypothetical protein